MDLIILSRSFPPMKRHHSFTHIARRLLLLSFKPTQSLKGQLR